MGETDVISMPRIRRELENFIPYSWETPTHEVAAKYGLKPESIIRMDLNTSPFQPKRWLASLSRNIQKIPVHLYPDASYQRLRQALAEYAETDIDEITVGNGADECLMMVSQTFMEKDGQALISYPSYSYFRVCAEIMGGKVVKVSRKPDFRDDVEGLLTAAKNNTQIVFLCSPNNPTGNLIEESELRKLLAELDAVIVVDEAYYEYCGKTFAGLVSSYSNLIVVRTMSKAFSLAGVRVGYAIAAEETIRKLNLVRPPNSVGVLSTALAQHALKKTSDVRKWVDKVVKERERVRNILEGDGRVKVYPSQANFLLIKFKEVNAGLVQQKLMQQGIVVRNLSDSVENSLRVTVLTRRENDRFLKALKNVLDEEALGGL